MTDTVTERRDLEPTVCCPDNLAAAFAGVNDARLRYVAAEKRWMTWDGRRWHEDRTMLALDRARDLCRLMLHTGRKTLEPATAVRLARRVGSAAMAREVVQLAQTSRLLAALPEQFDADAELLNTPDGILDLRTGAMGPHRRDAYLTRITTVAPAPVGTPCTAWSAWLDRLTGGDAALQSFLQRVAGRALTMRTAPPAPDAAPARSLFIATLARVCDDDRMTAALGECLALLPRAVLCADAARDPELRDRLAREHAAILRWAIDGVTAWRAQGLAMPDVVRQAAADDGAPFDAVDLWLEENVDRSAGAWELAGTLYASWKAWAERSGEPVGSHKRFSQALAARGLSPQREGSGRRGFAGLRLRNPDETSVGSVEATAPDPRPTAASLRPSSLARHNWQGDASAAFAAAESIAPSLRPPESVGVAAAPSAS